VFSSRTSEWSSEEFTPPDEFVTFVRFVEGVVIFVVLVAFVALSRGGSSGPRVSLLEFAGTPTDELAVSDSSEDRLAGTLVFI